MTIRSGPGASTNSRRRAGRELLLALGALVAFIILSFGLLVVLNPANAARIRAARVPSPGTGTSPIEITLVHTNDTWGYTEPCG